MIIEIPNAISSEAVQKIRSAIHPFVDGVPATTFYRDGKTVNISRTPGLHETNNYLHALFSEVQSSVLQQRYNPPFPSADSGYEYHVYRPGEVCRHHEDLEFSDTRQQETTIRYASVTLHLNTVENGGELVFPNQNKKVKTEAGKIVIFPPYGMFGHYTTPSEQAREVIVTWFVYDGIKAIRTK